MELNTAGESTQTNPEVITPPDSVATEQPTPDEQFAGLMGAAVNRMAGIVPPAPEAAPKQEQESVAPVAEAEPTATPEAAPQAPAEPEAPPLVKLKVNGEEIEIPQDKLEALAQQGLDYTRKTQALSERAKQLDAWNAIINRIQSDPALQTRFRALFEEQAQPQDQPKPTPPEDPIDRLKWEIRQELLGEIDPRLKELSARPQQLEQTIQLQAFKSEIQRDPLFPQAFPMVHQYVQSQPSFLRDSLYQRLDTDPQAFMEVYGAARQHLLAQQQNQPATPAAPAAPQQHVPAPAPAASATMQRTVTPREAPPVESAGPAGVALTESARKAKATKEITQRIRSNRASDSDLVDYLSLTGAFGRMGA